MYDEKELKRWNYIKHNKKLSTARHVGIEHQPEFEQSGLNLNKSSHFERRTDL